MNQVERLAQELSAAGDYETLVAPRDRRKAEVEELERARTVRQTADEMIAAWHRDDVGGMRVLLSADAQIGSEAFKIASAHFEAAELEALDRAELVRIAGERSSIAEELDGYPDVADRRASRRAALVGFANLTLAIAVGAGVIWGAAAWLDSWWTLVVTVPIAVSLFGLVTAALGSARLVIREDSRRDVPLSLRAPHAARVPADGGPGHSYHR